MDLAAMSPADALPPLVADETASSHTACSTAAMEAHWPHKLSSSPTLPTSAAPKPQPKPPAGRVSTGAVGRTRPAAGTMASTAAVARAEAVEREAPSSATRALSAVSQSRLDEIPPSRRYRHHCRRCSWVKSSGGGALRLHTCAAAVPPPSTRARPPSKQSG